MKPHVTTPILIPALALLLLAAAFVGWQAISAWRFTTRAEDFCWLSSNRSLSGPIPVALSIRNRATTTVCW